MLCTHLRAADLIHLWVSADALHAPRLALPHASPGIICPPSDRRAEHLASWEKNRNCLLSQPRERRAEHLAALNQAGTQMISFTKPPARRGVHADQAGRQMNLFTKPVAQRGVQSIWQLPIENRRAFLKSIKNPYSEAVWGKNTAKLCQSCSPAAVGIDARPATAANPRQILKSNLPSHFTSGRPQKGSIFMLLKWSSQNISRSSRRALRIRVPFFCSLF